MNDTLENNSEIVSDPVNKINKDVPKVENSDNNMIIGGGLIMFIMIILAIVGFFAMKKKNAKK